MNLKCLAFCSGVWRGGGSNRQQAQRSRRRRSLDQHDCCTKTSCLHNKGSPWRRCHKKDGRLDTDFLFFLHFCFNSASEKLHVGLATLRCSALFSVWVLIRAFRTPSRQHRYIYCASIELRERERETRDLSCLIMSALNVFNATVTAWNFLVTAENFSLNF